MKRHKHKNSPSVVVIWLLVFFLLPLSYGMVPEEARDANPRDADISFDIRYPTQPDLKTSYGEIFLEAIIGATNGIRRVSLNGRDLLDMSRMEAMIERNWERPGQQENTKFQGMIQRLKEELRRYHTYYLNQICPLTEGYNSLELLVEDNIGNQKAHQVSIQKIPSHKGYKGGHRMVLAIVPLDQKREDTAETEAYIYKRLLESFAHQARFNLVEREKLPWLMIEKSIQAGEISQGDVAKQIARVTPAEGVIFTDVQKLPDGIEIRARFVDVETGMTLLINRVFAPIKDFKGDKAFEDLNIIISGLAMKFRDAFPLCSGKIVKKEGRTIHVDIGSENGIFPGMIYNIFKNGKEMISKAVIQTVIEGSSTARIPKGEKSWGVKAGYTVSTR
ncbi:MAG: hypothetical protein ACMUIM_12025 [bacterium]